MKKLKCILLVDDDSTSNFLNKLLIEELNIAHEVVIHEDGEDAFQYIKSESFQNNYPEMILLDVNMPYANGFDFLEAIELLDFNGKPPIKIVILTASMRKFDYEKAKALKVIDVIEKPLTEHSLRSLLEKLFNYTNH